MENQIEKQGDINIVANNEVKEEVNMALIPCENNKSNFVGDNVPTKKEECYICEIKDNPFINYVLGEERKKVKDSADVQCIHCGKFMHDSCWDSFSRGASEKYKKQFSPAQYMALNAGKYRLCPSCLNNKLKINDNKIESLGKNNIKEKTNKDLEDNRNENGLNIKKQHLIIGASIIGTATLVSLLRDNKAVVVNVTR